MNVSELDLYIIHYKYKRHDAKQFMTQLIPDTKLSAGIIKSNVQPTSRNIVNSEIIYISINLSLEI